MPSKTTLYHCRNTLLHLGAVIRIGQKLVVASGDLSVKALLDEPPVRVSDCPPPSPVRDAFASLVLANEDCYNCFFRLFFPEHPKPTLRDFRSQTGSVLWRPVYEKGQVSYELYSELSEERVLLTGDIPQKSILYGVRDWSSTKQLRITDEYFDFGRDRSVIFPLRHGENDDGTAATAKAILQVPQDGSEWTTVSIRELQQSVCEREGFSVQSLSSGIKEFVPLTQGTSA